MNKSLLFRLSLVSFLPLAGYADQNLAGNVTVTGGSSNGNLNVTGSLDVDGPVVSFGTIGTSTVGNSLIFSDSTATSGTTGDTLTFSANRTSASWLWLHNASKSAMRLNSLHQLLLYQADGSTAGITLTPASNQISFGAATLSGSGSTLTAGGALTVTGALTASSGITNTNGTLTGGTTGLNLSAGGTNQNISLNSSGSGDIVFNTNGVERARIKSSGNVGIGTTTPGAKLDIQGGYIQTGDIGANYSAFMEGGNGVSSFGNVGTNDIRLGNSNNWGYLTIKNGGNVGIGTTNPSGKLHVVAGVKEEILTYLPTSASGINDFAVGGVGWSLSRPQDGGFTHAIYTYDSTGGAKNNLAISSRSDIVFTAGLSAPSASPERMRISENGNVGIGAVSPVTSLQVLGTVTAGSLDSTQGIDYLYGNYTPGKIFVLGSQYSSAASFLGFSLKAKPGDTGYLSSTSITVGRSSIEANNGYVAFLTGPTQTSTDGGAISVSEKMRIDSAGNVGIGTTNPQSKLQVGSYNFIKDGTWAPPLTPDAVSAGERIVFYQGGGWKTAIGMDPKNGIWFQAHTPSGEPAYQWFTGASATAPTEKMRIMDSGNVGIGTTNPTQKLSVAGTVRAYAVVVDTGWSDYVFDKDYCLAPLSEVEQQIKAEKHLPGIPSAADVAEHGVSLGDMQSKLLAKVEELTLHLIAQEKRMSAQQNEITALKSQNANFQKQLGELRTGAASP